MSDYLARQMGLVTWEVTKWGDDSRPLEVYTLTDRGRRGWHCTSPGCHGRPRCKHVRVVETRKRTDPHEMLAHTIKI